MQAWPWGQGLVRRESALVKGRSGSPKVAILAFGTVLHAALKAAEALDATVADMRFVKPLDEALVRRLAATHDVLVTVEEGCTMGGAGSAVLECLQAAQVVMPVWLLGMRDEFVPHGDPAKVMAHLGLDAEGIERNIRQRMDALIPAAAAD
jgi:1-deoxy-D-xylulose-5-phosphate synthase